MLSASRNRAGPAAGADSDVSTVLILQGRPVPAVVCQFRVQSSVDAVTRAKSCQFSAYLHVTMTTSEIQQTVLLHAALSLLVVRAEGEIIEFFSLVSLRCTMKTFNFSVTRK